MSYAYTRTPAVDRVSLTVRAGEAVAVMGPSGCGKSTLLLLAAGVVLPRDGEVTLDGFALSAASPEQRSAARRRTVGLVFQFGELVSELTLLDNVALARELGGMDHRQARAEARTALADVGLADLEHRKPGEVSGGQAQRAAVARAVVHRPSLVLADEPTGALDTDNAAAVLDLLLRLTSERDSALVVATHDEMVASRCQRILRMRDGRLLDAHDH